MSWPLRQSTAGQEIPLGPFVDSTDGNTAETGLTIANTDIKLQKNGATTQANKNSGGATHIATGDYYAVLDATDSDTVGPMRVKVHVSGALPVWLDCMVFEEAVYDELYAASAPGYVANAPVNVAQFGGSNGTFSSGRPEVNVSHFGGTAGTFATGIPQASLTTSAINSVADQVWDEATSGHVTAGSFGQAQNIIRANTAQAGAATTITLDASASAVDDFYTNQRIFITAGTGAGQGRIISDYVGSTKVATVATWATNPASDSVFVILPFGAIPGASAPTAGEVADAVWEEARADHVAAGSFGQYFAQLFRSGTAQAGAATTITLDASASATNDIYNYAQINIIGGTGAGQSRQITDYVGASKVATVGVAWVTQPSSDSVFLITPLGVDAATLAAIADAVWDEARSGHVTAGSFGEYTNADVVRISGDATSADNLESYTDGTTPMPVNATQISGDATAADNLEATLDGTGGVAITATFTGNLTGSVGSVSGAVASVTATVNANVTQVSGDATAADNLEAILDGTGGVTLVASAITLTTPITANMTQISGDATAADNLESYTDGTDRIGVDVREINSTAVVGNGAGTPWGP